MRILKLRAVRGCMGNCATGTIENRVHDGTFPPPLKHGQQRVWPEVEVDAVVAAIGAGYGESQLKDLTKKLVESRSHRAAKAIAEAVGVAK